jgi:DNA-binding NarL/FixJ family response regulator
MKISRFILVTDSYLVRKGLVSILNRIQGVRVLKEFGTDGPLGSFLQNHPVDFIIISQTGIDRSSDLFTTHPELLEKTILIEETVNNVPFEESRSQDVLTTIHLLEDKETLTRKIRDLLENQEEGYSETRAIELSPREITIVRLVSLGLTNRQIAERLYLSAHTVMTHRKNIISKLGIKSVSGLTIYAIVNNIITIEEVTSKPVR